MLLLSKFKKLFKRAVKEKPFAEEQPSCAKATFQKPIDNVELIKDVSNKKGNKTVVKKETIQRSGSLIDKARFNTLAKESNTQPTILKPEETKEETVVKDSKITPKHLPELSALEIAEQGAWEAKELKGWKPGELILNLYEVENVIEGGMGYVYIAEHQKWKVKMAIKSPNEYMLSDSSRFSRVLREANAWTELGLHPHIAYCYYVRKIEEVPHIFIEYVDGGNLNDWVKDARCYDLKIGLDIAIQICHGMEHAHGSGMIHRDIKLANILMTNEGVAKVTDFGIAGGALFETRGAGPDGEEKKEGDINWQDANLTSLAGTYDYMSPEQYEDAHNVNEKADIYSFGVCLYEMFCKRKPYSTASGVAASFLAKMDNKPPYEPCTLRKDIPLELAEILKKCCELDKDKGKRYESFMDLRGKLVGVYRGLFHEDPPHVKVDVLELKADGLNNRAVSYLDLGREEDARRCWEEALKADPQHLEATFNLGYLRWQKAEIPDDVLVTQMRELENSKGTNPDYWRCLAWIHFERGDVEAVEKIQQSKYKVEDEAFKKALADKDRPRGRLIHTLRVQKGVINSVTFSPDGCYALSGSWDFKGNGDIKLWDVENGRELRRFEGHIGKVSSVCFSPNGQFALSGGNISRLWDVESGKEIRRFDDYTSCIESVSFSPDGRYALSGSWDIRLWDTGSGRQIRRFVGHKDIISSLCFSPDCRYILSGSYDYTIRLWNIENGKEIWCFVGHTDRVNSVCFSPDGHYALSASGFFGNGDIKLWDVESGKELSQFDGHKGGVSSVCFSSDGHYLLSGSEDHTIRFWEVKSGRGIRCFVGHTDRVNSVCFSPDSRYALSASEDKTIRFWETHYPRKNWGEIHLYPFLCRVKIVEKLGVEIDKERVLLKSARDIIKKGLFYEAYHLLREGQSIPGYERNTEVLGLITLCGVKGKGRRSGLKGSWALDVLNGHTGYVNSVCFSPNGRHALSGSKDSTVRFWDIESRKEISKFEGHSGFVRSVSFSPDGRYALSGSGDFKGRGDIRLWDIESGKEIKRFVDRISYVSSVSFSPDGRYALSGSRSTPGILDESIKIRLWDIESGKEIKRFEGHTSDVDSVSFSPNGRYVISTSGYIISLWDIESGKPIKRFEGQIGPLSSPCFSPDSHYILSGSFFENARLWNVESGKEVRRFEGHTSPVYSVCFSPDSRYILSGGDKILKLYEIESAREIRSFEGHTASINSICFSPDGRYALSGSGDSTIKLWEFDWEWEF